MEIFGSIWDWITEQLGWMLEKAVDFLPDSPFTAISNSPVAEFLPYLNWIVPLDFIITSGTLWLTAIGVYYAYSVILRWIKAID